MKVPNVVKKIRKKLNLTQKQLADELGTISMTVSRWERGLNVPRKDILEKLSKLETKKNLPKDFSKPITKLHKKCLELELIDGNFSLILKHLSKENQEIILKAVLNGR